MLRQIKRTIRNFCSRPRALYAAIFTWISIINGRFFAPFLEHEANLTEFDIGMLFALYQLVTVASSFVAGSIGDNIESKYSTLSSLSLVGKGRAIVFSISVGIGSFILLLHGMKYFCWNGKQQSTDGCSNINFESIYWYGLLRVLSAISNSFLFPALDAMCLEYLKRHPDRSPQEYGKERLYGAISWAIINGMLGVTLDVIQQQEQQENTTTFSNSFAIVMYLATIVSTILAWWTIFVYLKLNCNASTHTYTELSSSEIGQIKRKSSVLEDDEDEKRPPQLQKEPEEVIGEALAGSATTTCDDFQNNHNSLSSGDIENDDATTAIITSEAPLEPISPLALLRILCMSAFGFSFVICTITLSSGMAIVENLVFLFFESLGSNYTKMGLTVIVTVIFEIPIFHVAPKLLHDWGAGRLLLVAAACYITRVVGYTLVPEGKVGLVLFLEPLHGVTFACFTTAGVETLSQLAPRGSEGTAQSLLQLFIGAGSILGLLFGGWGSETLGPRLMYRLSALVVLLGSLLFGIVLRRYGDSTRMTVAEAAEGSGITTTELSSRQHHRIKDQEVELTGLATGRNDTDAKGF